MKKTGPTVLIGFKGCGKSSVGKVLAEKQKTIFTDTDSAIELLHMERTSKKLEFREIYKKHGEDYFKALEAEAVQATLALDKGVVSLGGGTLMNMRQSDSLKKPAIFVYITVDNETLFQRIIADGIPAFFDKDNPRVSFEEIFKKREPVYKEYADITVDNTDRTVENVADEIIAQLKNLSFGG